MTNRYAFYWALLSLCLILELHYDLTRIAKAIETVSYRTGDLVQMLGTKPHD